MKAYTNMYQSKKLAEILPVESADMYYQYVLPKSGKIKHNPKIGNPVNALKWYNEGYTTSGKEPITLDEYCIPIWSFAALLEIIRNSGRYELQMYEGGYYFEANGFITESYFNAVGACVELILKLHEQKLL